MGTYEELKAAIQQVIRTNGNNEITGALLQNALLSIVNIVGANATFAGIATPNTNPGTADQNVFYLATEVGTYVNFGGIEINMGEAVILSNKTGNWVKTTSGFATQKQVTELESDLFSTEPIIELTVEIGTYDGAGTAATNDKAIRTMLVNLPRGKFYIEAEADQITSSFKIMRKNTDGSFEIQTISGTAVCIDTELDPRPFLLVFYFDGLARSDYSVNIKKAKNVRINKLSDVSEQGTTYIIYENQTSNNVVVPDSDNSKIVLYKNESNKILQRIDIPIGCKGISYITPKNESIAIFFYYASGNPCARYGFYTGQGVISIPKGSAFFRPIVSSSVAANDYELSLLMDMNTDDVSVGDSFSLPSEIGTYDGAGTAATNDKAIRTMLVNLPRGKFYIEAEADQITSSFKIMRKNTDGSFETQTYDGSCAYVNNTSDVRLFYMTFYFNDLAKKSYSVKIKNVEEQEIGTFAMRVAFWNIGKFSMGQQSSTTITNTNAERLKMEYRKVFDETSASVMGFAEFSPIFNKDSQTTPKAEILCNYPYSVIGPEYEYNMNAIFSAYMPINTANKNFKKRTQQRYAKEATFVINGKIVIYVATHLDWDNKEYLQSQINELIDWYKDEKCVVIGGDFNTSGKEGTEAFEAFTECGYTMLNHDYLGDIATYPTGSAEIMPDSAIDNIVCKGVVIVNRQVKQNEGLSDHCLISCDLIIL